MTLLFHYHYVVNIFSLVCVAETRGDVAEDPRRLHAKQGHVRPKGDSAVPREGGLHRQGAGGVVHAAKVQDHEE